MAKIHKLQKEGKTIYPVTIPQAIKDPHTEESIDEYLERRFNELERRLPDADGKNITLGSLANVDTSFDSAVDDIYSFKKEQGVFFPIVVGGVATIVILRHVSSPSSNVALGSPYQIEFMFSSKLDGEETGDGFATVMVNNRIVASATIPQGNYQFEIGSSLRAGSNNVTVEVSDSYGVGRRLIYDLNVIEARLESSFNHNQVFTEDFLLRVTPFGYGRMVITLIMDELVLTTQETVISNRPIAFNIPRPTHGFHIIKITMEMPDDGIFSNELIYDIIAIQPNNNTVIISSPFNQTSIDQYGTFAIPYRVYNPQEVPTNVELYVNDELFSTRSIDRTLQHWNYSFATPGLTKLTIRKGDQSIDFHVTVNESDISEIEETDQMILKLTSAGRSNSEESRNQWVYQDIQAQFNNFNWSSNGWLTDSEGSVMLKVSGEATVNIPLKVFSNDFKRDGKTIEFEFITQDVTNLDYVLLSCMDNNIGFEVTSQKATFRSAQTTVITQFKEDEHIRISFTVQQSTKQRLVYMYINGVLSGVAQYPNSDTFVQRNPVDITIQGALATIGIYAIRVYDVDMEHWQVLNNFIFDYPSLLGKSELFLRNNILDATGKIAYNLLVDHIPCMVITGELPTYKGDKKTLKVTLEDRKNPERSFNSENVTTDVQGTSSQYYPRKNYKMKFNSGFNMVQSGQLVEGFSTSPNVYPTNTFTHKADFAEASGTHNTGLAKVINQLLMDVNILTPPQKDDSYYRNAVDGFAMVIFHQPTDESSLSFIGKYNFNTDKGALEVFGFDADTECWEATNNTSDRTLFKNSDEISPDWDNDWDGRHYGEPTFDNLKRLTDWVVSCTDNPTKFRNEFHDYFDEDHLIAFYVITELFGMVDQRAKNCFWVTFDKLIWLPLYYDNDTVLGINNEGVNAFYFDIEYHDRIGTQTVWNGEDSNLWDLVERAFHDEIKAMYQRFRANNTLTYDKVLAILNGEHSNLWSETVYNEDGYFKYVLPLINDGIGAYLYAAQGSREEHRKWWLYNRFRYLDSKYDTGDFKSDFITMRLYTPTGNLAVPPDADFTVKVFASQYIQAKWGSYITSKRVQHGDTVVFEAPSIQFNDTETILYGASYLSSIGDLSGKYAGTVDTSAANKLTELIIGSGVPGYQNTNLLTLYVGNNKLLRHLDIQNCPNLKQNIDLSQCDGIEEVYALGSSITGIELPSGSNIKTLELPDTLTTLKLVNQSSLKEENLIIAGGDNIVNLILENNPHIDTYHYAVSLLEHDLQNVRLIGINAEDENLDNLYHISKKSGIDDNGYTVPTAVVTGKIHVDIADSYYLNLVQNAFPSLAITYNVLTITPTRTFVFLNEADSSPMKNILVTINGEEYYTDSNGEIEIRNGSLIRLYVDYEGYKPIESIFGPTEEAFITHTTIMVNYVTVTFQVRDTEGKLLLGASVNFNSETKTTNNQGMVEFSKLTKGVKQVNVVMYGKTYSDNINVGYEDMQVTCNKVVTPTRTIIVRRIQNNVVLPNTSIFINNEEYLTDSQGRVILRDNAAVNVTVNLSGYKSESATFPTFTTDTVTNYINLVNYVTVTVLVEDKNGIAIPGAEVTLGSIVTYTGSNGKVAINNILNGTYNLKVEAEETSKQESLNVGYFDITRTLTLPLDSIMSMKPLPNGNVQLLIQTTTANEKITMHSVGHSSSQIDWGDGSALETISTTYPEHTYTTAGLYNIEVKNGSTLTFFNVREDATGPLYTLIAYWTVGNTAINNLFNNTTYWQTASKPTRIKVLGEDIFKNDGSRLSFENTFYGCTGITSVPENIFAMCVEVTDFGGTFSRCESLTTVPSNLFSNNPNVTTFSYTFNDCSALTSIPAGLFSNNPNVTSFDWIFYKCTALTSIPESLFDGNPNVTTFQGTFDGSALTSIPAGLFSNNPNVTDFGGAFNDCSALTSIPAGLFSNNPNVTDFGGAFSRTAITSIPESLFDGNPNVTTFSYTFAYCSALTSIPAGLFSNNPNVTSFEGTFDGSALTSIPESLFDSNSKIANLKYTFYLNKVTGNLYLETTSMSLALNNSFYSTTGVKLIIRNTVPFTVTNPPTNITYLVPIGTSDAYKLASGWAAVAHLIFESPLAIPKSV